MYGAGFQEILISKEEILMVNIQKAAVIGCGFVGSTIAYTLMQKGVFSEMVLLDANHPKAEGEAMDISHAQLPLPCDGYLRGNL